jgi:PHS family inorganic phosphate transporter-like MFS transporter
MLSTVFFMQPIGTLMANVVAVITVSSFKASLPMSMTANTCQGECADTVDKMWRWIVGIGAIPPAFAILLRWWIPESPRYTLEVEKDPDKAKHDVNSYYQQDSSPEPGPSHAMSPASNASTQATLTFGEPMEMKDLTLSEPAMATSTASTQRTVQKETWREFWTGFHQYMITEGNWTDLAGTSLAWMTLDFAFYFLGVNSQKILSKVWGSGTESYSGTPSLPLYPVLLQNSYRAIIAVSVGGVLGGLLFIKMARFRYHLQVSGFWILAGLFIAIGVCFVVLLGTRYFAAVIVLYSICNLFFNFGPNTSTFVVCLSCACFGILDYLTNS